MLQRYVLQNTSQRHNLRCKQTPPATQDPSTTPRTTNQQQDMISKRNLAYNEPPLLLPLPTQHTTATHPALSSTHYHTLPAMQYLTTHQTTVPLYPNPPPLHAIPYTTSPSSTPTQSLHPPQISALAPQTHYPTFPRIVIPPQFHTPHLNTQDGYQRMTQRGTTANNHNFFFMGRDPQCTTIILNNMMAVMSPTPASWSKPTYTQ